jgi:hypothetical protein
VGLDGVRRTRVDLARGERVRWLSAVLIVTAITGIGVAVRIWPAPVRSAASTPVPVLASRSLPLFAPPVSPRTASASVHAHDARRVPPRAPAVGRPIADAPPVAAARPEAANDAPPVPPMPAVSPRPGALLAARHANVPLVPPAVIVPPPVAIPAPAQVAAHGLVELPAVVVTRAVSVAGRGILAGLRVTGAAVKAAF